MQTKVLIISGGTINETFFVKHLEAVNYDYIIVADAGLLIADKLNLKIDYIVGDFDTVDTIVLEKYRQLEKKGIIRIEEHSPAKDVTDTELALQIAFTLQPSELVLVGALGTRFDHTISNVQLLLLALKEGIKTYLLDEKNKIYLLQENTTFEREALYGTYISFLPITATIEEVSLIGFQYSLENYKFERGTSLGISNQVIDPRAYVRMKSGIFLVVEAND